MDRVQLYDVLGHQVVELPPPYRFDDMFVFLMHDGPSVRVIPDNDDGKRLLRNLRSEFFRDSAGTDQSKNFGVDEIPLTPDELTDDPTGRASRRPPYNERQFDHALIAPDVAWYIIRRRGGKRWWDLNHRFPNVQFFHSDAVLAHMYYTAYASGGETATVRRIDAFERCYVRAKVPRYTGHLADGARIRATLERGGTTLFPLEIVTAHLASILGYSIITSRLHAYRVMAHDVNVIPYNIRNLATWRKRNPRPDVLQEIPVEEPAARAKV
jgi:hypothetical protein